MGALSDILRGGSAGINRNAQRVAATEQGIIQQDKQNISNRELADNQQQVGFISDRIRNDKTYAARFNKAEKLFPSWQTDKAQRRQLSSNIENRRNVEDGISSLVDQRMISPSAAAQIQKMDLPTQQKQVDSIFQNVLSTERQFAGSRASSPENILANQTTNLTEKAQITALTANLRKNRAKKAGRIKEIDEKAFKIRAALLLFGKKHLDLFDEGVTPDSPEGLAAIVDMENSSADSEAKRALDRLGLTAADFVQSSQSFQIALQLTRSQQAKVEVVAEEVENANFGKGLNNGVFKNSTADRRVVYSVDERTGLVQVNNLTTVGPLNFATIDLGPVLQAKTDEAGNPVIGNDGKVVQEAISLDALNKGMDVNINLGNFRIPVSIDANGAIKNRVQTRHKLVSSFKVLRKMDKTKSDLEFSEVRNMAEEMAKKMKTEASVMFADALKGTGASFVDAAARGFRSASKGGDPLNLADNPEFRRIRAALLDIESKFGNDVTSIFRSDASVSKGQGETVSDFISGTSAELMLLQVRYNLIVQQYVESLR